jgi:hypothetical protein
MKFVMFISEKVHFLTLNVLRYSDYVEQGAPATDMRSAMSVASNAYTYTNICDDWRY